MDTIDSESRIGVGYTRVSYRKIFLGLFRISFAGRQSKEDREFQFKAVHLIGDFWWVNRKSFQNYVSKFDYPDGTYDSFRFIT